MTWGLLKTGEFYTLHSTGHNLVNAITGANEWTEEGEGWTQSYLIQKSSTDGTFTYSLRGFHTKHGDFMLTN